jgi:hypothetical protein
MGTLWKRQLLLALILSLLLFAGSEAKHDKERYEAETR